MAKLKGKVALVTGASRGIGKSIAQKLVEYGAKILITYKDNIAAANAVEKTLQGKTTIHPLNVCDARSIDDLADFIKTKFKKIDILINNAGINKPNDFDKISEEDWDEVMDTNLKGAFLVSQKFLPLIRKGGSIVNISSVSGQYGGPRTTHYACSKAGLISLTQNMAIYCAKKKLGIRVNCVSPGLIESEMAGAAKDLGVNEKILLGRQGKPEEVAEVVAFLASEEASYITAQTININGGLYF